MCISKLGQFLLRQNFRAILKVSKSPITTALSTVFPDFFKYYFPRKYRILENRPSASKFPSRKYIFYSLKNNFKTSTRPLFEPT